MNKLILILLSFLFHYQLISQISWEHQIGISINRNINYIENYEKVSEMDFRLFNADSLTNFTLGGIYYLDVVHKNLFLRSGFATSYNKPYKAVIKDYFSFSVPLYFGYKIYNFNAFAGLNSKYNYFRFTTYDDGPISEDNCLCNVKKFHFISTVGLEYVFKKKIIFGMALNLPPRKLLLSDQIYRIDRTNFTQIHLTYKFK